MSKKYKLLILSILFDGIGMLSFLLPGIGEFFDIIWAPISAYAFTKMYKGKIGKIGAVISFIEEAGILGSDFIPTFSLVWIYKFVWKKEN